MKNSKIYKNNKSLVAKCECSCGVLEISSIDDLYNRTWEVSLFKLTDFGGPLSFYQRLRWCRKILFSGRPWIDQVMISDQSMGEVAQFILERRESGLTKSEDSFKVVK